VAHIEHKLNINSFEKLAASQLELNDLSVVTIKTDKPIAFEAYRDNSPLGSFILIDRINSQTVAAGMIAFARRRSRNIHRHKLEIDREVRRNFNSHSSKVLLFTGLSGSGKSTIANALHKTSPGHGFVIPTRV